MWQRTILLQAVMLLVTAATTICAQAERTTRPAHTEADAHAGRGLDYYRAGRFKEAADELKQAVLLKADNPAVYYNLGMACVQLGRYLESGKAFQTAIRLNPKYSAAYSKLGAVYSYFGQYQEAAQLLERAVRLDPRGADAYNNLGVAYYHLNR